MRSAGVQTELAAFDSRMHDLDSSQQAADDEDLVMERDGLDLAQNPSCPITLIPVRSCTYAKSAYILICSPCSNWLAGMLRCSCI